MQISEHQKQLDTYYTSQSGEGFWLDKYKPYQSLYRDRLLKRNACIAAALPAHLNRVLDLGCGRGDIMAQLAPRAEAVVGTDLAEVMVQATRANLAGRGQVTALCCPAETLPFADASFDAVVMADVVEHLLDVKAALHECRRVLRPGGHLVITTPNAPMEYFWQRFDSTVSAPRRALGRVLSRRARPAKPPVHEQFFAARELAALAHECAFKISSHRLIEFYPGAEGGGSFGRALRLVARHRGTRTAVVEPFFRAAFSGIEALHIFNNRQLLVLQKPA